MRKFRLLRADEIDCRPATIKTNGCSLLLYKDARVDMRILDETVGAENWQRSHTTINGNLFCRIGIKCGDEWVWKEDVGSESNMERQKGEASDSFKRAGFNWGIGRELYSAPFIWINGGVKEVNGKPQVTSRYHVSEINYDKDDNICGLEIQDEHGKVVFTFGDTFAQEIDTVKTSDTMTQQIGQDKVRVIAYRCKEAGIVPGDLLKAYNVTKIEDLTEIQFAQIVREWPQMVTKYGGKA